MEYFKGWFSLSATSNKSGSVTVASNCLTCGQSYWLHFHYRTMTHTVAGMWVMKVIGFYLFRVTWRYQIRRHLLQHAKACLYWKSRGSGVKVAASGHCILMPALKMKWVLGGGDGGKDVVMRQDLTMFLSWRAASGQRAPREMRSSAVLRPLGVKQKAHSRYEWGWTNSLRLKVSNSKAYSSALGFRGVKG